MAGEDLVKSVPQEKLCLDDGWKHVINYILKINPRQFVSGDYLDFNSLIYTSRGFNQNMRNFETRFEAQASRFNAHNAGSILDSLVALMILANWNVDDIQRVSILAAAVSNVNMGGDAEPAVAKMLGSVKYASMASVLRQCEMKGLLYRPE